MTFEWDDGNRKHLARHGVTPDEAEELFKYDPYEHDVQDDVDDTYRFKLIGETNAGHTKRRRDSRHHGLGCTAKR